MKHILPLLTFTLFSISAYSQHHIDVISYADDLLQNSNAWNDQDDRLCEDDASHKKYSLYCVLYLAQIEVFGKYKHRGKVMRAVRKVIKNEMLQRFKHPIRDYNNLETTRFEDVKMILEKARKELN